MLSSHMENTETRRYLKDNLSKPYFQTTLLLLWGLSNGFLILCFGDCWYSSLQRLLLFLQVCGPLRQYTTWNVCQPPSSWGGVECLWLRLTYVFRIMHFYPGSKEFLPILFFWVVIQNRQLHLWFSYTIRTQSFVILVNNCEYLFIIL